MIRIRVSNDTIMQKIAQNQSIILNIFIKGENYSSSELHSELLKKGSDISLITVKRELTELKDSGFLSIHGLGRSVVYSISTKGRFFIDINAHEYCIVEPDKRYGQRNYNHDLFNSISGDIFTDFEKKELENATSVYKQNIKSISNTLEEKELERFIIELSWKSSKIEGNTYTLLDTEKLIKEGIEAKGHNKFEAMMILNHKQAFKIIRENIDEFKIFKLSTIEEIHKILVKDLNVNFGLREKAVGVTGSTYRPLDNIHQIKEAIELLCVVINKISSPYEKAMIALLGLSYIQPFEDGNKRTSRLVANAILLANGLAPLSYRSVDENEYKEAILVFYELNSISPFKKIFIEQYIFSAENYSVK